MPADRWHDVDDDDDYNGNNDNNDDDDNGNNDKNDDDDNGNNDNNDDDDILTCACSPARPDARKPAPDVFASSDD